MPLMDARGCVVTGASARALEHFERALAAYQLSRGDPRAHARAAISEAPGFAMARLLEAYLCLGGREPDGARNAARLMEAIAPGSLNARERGHFAALTAAVAGELETAGALLGSVLREHPRDVLALQVAHAFDYLTGDVQALRSRVEDVLPAWSQTLPGFHAVLSMLAFGLEECGAYERAQDVALHAIELEPHNLRAHHAMAHVFEMQGRAREGTLWMERRASCWAAGSPMARHHWWHLALFQLEADGEQRALATYDRRIGPDPATISDLIDASALLWRLHLRGVDLAARWRLLAERWAPHAKDAHCAFNDVHAMMAFARAGRWDLAHLLLAAQSRSILRRGSNGDMTRLVGLPASRALLAFGRGEYAAAEEILSRLPPAAQPVGGSRAQRNVLDLTRASTQVRLSRKAAARVLRAA